ncbi:hypothetical protein PLEOSDRAFT_1114630 [Pleurotus ostreatus PC15]|uniref:Uncharacterized protein n=1 Tax=Pleurotus ostreatus (strain PC15) TaxID=1137138 RepID=A0A067N6K6_PLEO1|nr:hypothetical protein PLEOSDRAFT_1114630 [Pleurotus ostreatus PC15]
MLVTDIDDIQNQRDRQDCWNMLQLDVGKHEAIDGAQAHEQFSEKGAYCGHHDWNGRGQKVDLRFVQRIHSFLHAKDSDRLPYILALETPDYQEVMKHGGGLLTAMMNLFVTKFDQVFNLAEKRADDVDYVILDTVGQIEKFTWSASGAIVTDAVP